MDAKCSLCSQNYYHNYLYVYVCVVYGMWICVEEYQIIYMTMCDYRYCSYVVEDGRWNRLDPE